MVSEGGECTHRTELTAPPPFDELYNEYKDRVFCFAYYLTQNRGEAEDLFQEAWLRIVKSLPEKVSTQSLKAWMFVIVSNLHRDNLRKKRVRRLFLSKKPIYLEDNADLFPDMSVITHSNLSDETSYADMGRDIARAIAGLPDRQRRVFLLKEIVGFQQAEICDVLGIPLGTVKSLMYRAVKQLQRKLSAYNPKRERLKCDVKTLSV